MLLSTLLLLLDDKRIHVCRQIASRHSTLNTATLLLAPHRAILYQLKASRVTPDALGACFLSLCRIAARVTTAMKMKTETRFVETVRITVLVKKFDITKGYDRVAGLFH